MAYVQLSERKAMEAARRRAAVTDLKRELAAYARAHGGRFILFGSAARDEMRYHSDVDLLVDFPPQESGDAWNFAEEACWNRKLDPDLCYLDWYSDAFLNHIAPDAQELG